MIIDPSAVPPAEFYGFLIRSVLPRPIAWVSTRSPGGVDNLAPYSFFNAVSGNPPVLMFSPGRAPDREQKDTLANVLATREFVVNVVTESVTEQMNTTATEYPTEVSEFEVAGVTRAPAHKVAPPRVAESPIQFECTLLRTVPIDEDGGGSVVVFGRIVLMHVDARVLREGKVDAGLLQAVGRLGGMEYAFTRDRFTLVRRKYEPPTE